MARKPLSKKLRFDVFKRDGFTCQYCGAHPPKVVLECDHIQPVSDGGLDEVDNLITSCFNCNRGKAATPLEVAPKSLKDKAVEAAELEAQLQGYQDVLSAIRSRVEREAFDIAYRIYPHMQGGTVSKADLQSIKLFLRRLGFDAVFRAAERADALPRYKSDFQRFKYFCGTCWGMIKSGEGLDGDPS